VAVSKRYRPYNPTQSYLLPPSPLEWLPEGHLARFVLSTVAELDLSAIYGHYEAELRGFPPHHPKMMVGLLLYAYCVGVPSSRKIETKTHEDVAFRVISGDQHPDHTRISEFRRVHLEALAQLFTQVLEMCCRAGLVKLGHVALDGTKMKANASKRKAMSFERLEKEEQRLRDRVDALLKEAEEVDAAEDALYGDKRGDELPPELCDEKKRLEFIRRCLAEMRAEASTAVAEHKTPRQLKRERENAKKRGDGPPPPPTATAGQLELPSHKIRIKARAPHPKAQRNFTDADSRIMKSSADGFIQGYNAQAAVDDGHQIVVAHALTNQPPDVEHFVPMLHLIRQNLGRKPKKMTADSGYWSEMNVKAARRLKIEPYIATERSKHHEVPSAPRGPIPNGKKRDIRYLMKRKLATVAGRLVYRKRMMTVEPVFGQIKEARGFRRFLLRGLAKVRGEWALITTGHNLLKLHAAS
jgi:transposase